MEDKLKTRQQIERDYHNQKYKTDSDLSSSGIVNSAYDFYQTVIEHFPIGRILDFGCGDGWASIKLAQNGHDVYGIDISQELIGKARNAANLLRIPHRLHFEEMSGENLLFDNNFFDAVVGSAVLHHTDIPLALKSIYRVLKPGGRGIFIEPMNQNLLLRIWRMMTPWRRSPVEKALTMHEINLILNMFPKSQLWYFNFISIISIGLVTMFPKSLGMKQFNNVLEKLDRTLLKNVPALRKYCAVVVIELEKS